MQAEFMPAPGEVSQLIKIKTDISGRRLLNIQFPLEATGATEHAAILLKRYLSRKGEWSPLKSLFDAKLVTNVVADVDTYRDQTFLRVMIDLTAVGEGKLAEVAETVSGVLGSIANKGMSEHLLNDLKMSYALTHVGASGLMDIAEEFAKAAEKYGLENLDAHAKLVIGVKPADITDLAARANPERAQLTLISPTVKGAMNPYLGRNSESVDAKPVFERMKAAYDRSAALNSPLNPFLHLDETQKIINKGVAVVVAPNRDTPKVEARIEFSFPKDLTAAEKMGADLAILAFRLDPKNTQLFDQIEEAAVQLELGFSPSESTLSIKIAGEANASSLALAQVIARLRSFKLDEPKLARAIEHFTKRMHDLPATGVSQQALMMGINRAMGGPGPIDIEARAKEAQAVDLPKAVAALEKCMSSWAVKGAFTGNWSALAAAQTIPLILPQNPLELENAKHDSKMKINDGPELVGRVVEHNRQGVARIYPVEVAKFSEEYWAFEIFSAMLSKHLMDIMRGELGLVYAVQAGFDTLPTGGAALFLVGDSSHKAASVAMGFSATLESALNGGVTDADYKTAITQVVRPLAKTSASGKGLYGELFDGMNPIKTVMTIKGLNRAKVLAIVNAKLAASRKIDAVAVGQGDPVCRELLTKRALPGSSAADGQ
jgi:secreted Zn-dependent insulinase-like peptidase